MTRAIGPQPEIASEKAARAAYKFFIWSRLYRGNKSRSRYGLGLRLSLVKAVVEMHQGKVMVASAVNRGPQFEVRLPKTVNARASHQQTNIAGDT